MVFDETMPEFDELRFQESDWSEYYPDAAEAIPPNHPEPRGNVVSTSCFADTDHPGCQVTRRFDTGIVLYVNRAPIARYCKRQKTVEACTFAFKFIALKIDLIEGVRYKLRMVGIPFVPTSLFCDNESVVKNTTAPESRMKKCHTAICYHRTREACAAGFVRIAHEDGDSNVSDLLTKLMPGPRMRDLLDGVLW
jgi:hypothetical protein